VSLDMTASWLQQAREVELRARVSGDLAPIATRAERIETETVAFAVRVVESLARKPRPSGDVRSSSNPFLPYEPALYVCDVAPRHVCLLNKFQVVSTHVLLVTREFERQEAALDAGDFEALWWCLGQADGLGFYNGGLIAGASQPHKHLQVIPYLDSEAPGFPLLTVWDAATPSRDGLYRAPLPFPHALAPLELPGDDPALAGRVLHASYCRLLESLQRGDPRVADPLPYNLLVTRRWMFAVPRQHETAAGISLNALAFAGGLLVRDDDQLAQVRQCGPLNMLAEVTGATRSPVPAADALAGKK
jgi:sulfate adenylyltransferase (ADP) / ATP adenylyltransferase